MPSQVAPRLPQSGQESEQTAIFWQLQGYRHWTTHDELCVLTWRAPGRWQGYIATVAVASQGLLPDQLDLRQWPLMLKVCCQKNTRKGQKVIMTNGWGEKGKTQQRQRPRNIDILPKKTARLPKMHKWLTSCGLCMSHLTILILCDDNVNYLRFYYANLGTEIKNVRGLAQSLTMNNYQT